MEIWTIDHYSSFIESPQGIDKQNSSDSKSEDESIPKKASLDKIE